MRDFKVGDKVRFELDADGVPRWNFGRDKGPASPRIFAVATVDRVYPDSKEFSVRGDETAWSGWGWPQPSDEYFENLFQHEGFVQLYDEVDDSTKQRFANGNDGRTRCYACGGPVKVVASFTSIYGVCSVCGK